MSPETKFNITVSHMFSNFSRMAVICDADIIILLCCFCKINIYNFRLFLLFSKKILSLEKLGEKKNYVCSYVHKYQCISFFQKEVNRRHNLIVRVKASDQRPWKK